jgi:two-component system alkaline phosphatase synthesis response regulator PhoP
MAHRILLVEDEENILEVVKLNLELEGYHVVAVKNGKAALKQFDDARFDLIILDVMLPEIDGFAIAETIRLTNQQVPIFFITAKNTSEDRVRGLKIGGDDYLAKPFNLEELLLRVQLLIKRKGQNADSSAATEAQFSGNVIQFSNFRAQNFEGIEISLSKRETALLKLLIDRAGDVVSRKEILEKVWGYDIYPSTRTIDNFILQFRKHFEPDPKNPVHFHSIRGVGYQFSY